MIKPKDLTVKNISNNDINIINNISPLLCVYKKSSSRLKLEGKRFTFNDETFKREIIIRANGFMTLSLLDLCEYYRDFQDNDLQNLYKLYLSMAKDQLDFYASHLRNSQGVFVDKKDLSDSISNEFKLEQKRSSFKFSDQALLMCAYYKYSDLSSEEDSSMYRDFSYDILKMFLDYKSEIYPQDCEELLDICFALNLFYELSRNKDTLNLSMDLEEYICDNYLHVIDNSFNHLNKLLLNTTDLSNYSDLDKYKELNKTLYERLLDYYDDENSIFMKKNDDLEYNCEESVLYLLNCIRNCTEKQEYIISNVFRNLLLDSGLILSWPDAPNLDSPERYINESMKSEDMIEEENYKMMSMGTPESTNFAPIFIKRVKFNKKRKKFKKYSNSFDSKKNLFLYYILLHYQKPKHKKQFLNQ
ncbi:hypothetical protein [Clostridium cellulovorans]|nr:hypothetical protein [Clostridium cellulovorans]